MRTLQLLVVLAALGLAACSESPSGQGPKKPGLSSGMSEDIWKAYSGTESGVGEAGKDQPGEKGKDQPGEKK
jgi:hypothetical protein